MRVLVTGHDGYVGAVLAPLLASRGHEVVGLDTRLFDGCVLPPLEAPRIPSIERDLRDVGRDDLEGFDAVAHLAAVSNDPLGALDEAVPEAVNHEASVRLARLAKEAGAERFLFASSCSLYGAAGADVLDEDAPFNPVTAYGRSKVLAERDLARLADDRFSPVFLRSATAYGVSPRLRMDLVLNDFVGTAHATGEIRVLSDGTPWRPLVHVGDIANAFAAALEAPRELVHGEAFNVGRDEDNYRISELASLVADATGARVVYAGAASPDTRSYRVSFRKAAERLPGFRPAWTVPRGIAELLAAFESSGTSLEELRGPRFVRLARVEELRAEGAIDASLRRTGRSRREGRSRASRAS